jgi:hypothetical protein
MSEKIRIAIALIGGFLITAIFNPQWPTNTLVIWAIVAVVLWMILSSFSSPSYARHGSMPAGFQSTFRAQNIAMDATSHRLWLRPDRGDPIVLEKSQISEWAHEWLMVTGGPGIGQKRNNCIVFKVRDITRPVLTVKFPNYRSAEEWQARLSEWKNG